MAGGWVEHAPVVARSLVETAKPSRVGNYASAMPLQPGQRRQRSIWRRRLVAVAALIGAALAAGLVLKAAFGVSPRGAHVTELTIRSNAVGRKLRVSVVVPPGGGHVKSRPLLVFLHGRGGSQHSFFKDRMFAALARLGPKAPIVAFPYGGENSYWHDRADGDWGRYVMNEVIPQVVRRFRADPRRVAIGGVSMGGFGAYDIARLHPGRFCAVGGHSPALWVRAGQTAPGAFDDADDFARNDVIAAARTAPEPFLVEPIWLDAGDADPFQPGDRAFVRALRSAGADLTARTWPGSHEGRYWNRHWNAYLHFYANAFRDCRR